MAARKKNAKKATRKASARKGAAAASRKARPAAGGKKAASKAQSPTHGAPKTGVKEEHYADLRRVALANALARLR